MEDVEPSIEERLDPNGATLVLRGEWVASHTDRLEQLAATVPKGPKTLALDIGDVDRLDTFGAWAIESLRRSASDDGAEAVVTGASASRATIISQMRSADTSPPAAGPPGLVDDVATLGGAVEGAVVYVLAALSMVGRLVLRLLTGLRTPKFLRGSSIVHHLDRVGVRAVPIVVLMTFLIGCIISQQGLFYFRKFGASDYVVNLVTVLVLRELGVILVSIMLAGRSGSSYAAEIGSMKMREEIDALRTMGLDPVDLLILPRVLALIIAAPMLTVLGMLSALFGAGLVMWLSGEMQPAVFLVRLHAAASYTDFEVGLIKAPVMALVIGVIAAIEGFKVEGSAESLGLGTTASVVKSIFLVIVLDGMFAVLFTSLGM
jgi:phospholipid/cholesterol/gamma-HCH transport system permease protein